MTDNLWESKTPEQIALDMAAWYKSVKEMGPNAWHEQYLQRWPEMNWIFVFGSNLQGIHGAGAAKYAYENHGAERGKGEGLQGNSYAIPTKRTPWESLSLTEIEPHIEAFIRFAKERPDLQFNITPIGTGRAGHTVQGIAPMFKDAVHLSNVHLPPVFLNYLA